MPVSLPLPLQDSWETLLILSALSRHYSRSYDRR